MEYIALWSLGLPLAIVLVIGLIVLLIAVFEIWMLVDVITNKLITSERKVLWIIGMLLIHPFVAIIYYFTDHKGRNL
ncbi:MAG TPA: hypothetical protein VFN51_01850 [Candidatus Saccharimonadales bacterium]|nr:hypothetical protein [Candidatus Saccharimonadales bacterium]